MRRYGSPESSNCAIGDIAGNTICIQQLDDMRDLISLLDGQFTITRAFEDADTAFFQQPQGRI